MIKPKQKRLSTLLKTKLDLYKRTSTKNSMGEPIETISLICSLWGALWPVSAREHVQAGRETLDISHRLRIRYRTGVTQDMFFKSGSREFEIIQGPINVDESNRLIDFVVKERL